MHLNAIIFDLDGTLSDSIGFTIYSIKRVIRDITGVELSNREILNEFGPSDTDIIQNIVADEYKDKSVDTYLKFYSKNFCNMVRPIEGVGQTLELLKSRNVKIGLVTGRGEQTSRIMLKKLEIEHFFDDMVFAEDVKRPKPDPEGINKVVSKFDIRPNEVAYVGDFSTDIIASERAGVFSIFARWTESVTGDDDRKVKPDKSFQKVSEFKKWIKEVTE